MPSDTELESGLHNSRLVNKQATGILYMIESKIRNRTKYATALLGLNRYSLEHIMPKKWENHWPKVSTDDERATRYRKLLTLGNLTIITASLNSSIRDADWLTKKEGIGEKQGLKQYASGIETFSHFMDEVNWDENAIKDRAAFLYKQAKVIWEV